MRKVLLLLILAVITTANVGCCARFRNWLHRGSLCGTTTAAPAMMSAPVPMGPPATMQAIAPPIQQIPVMPQQFVMPQQQFIMPQQQIQCCPQQMCVPCMPCDPCADVCSPCPPQAMWYGGYVGSDEFGTSSMVDQGYVVPESQEVPRTYNPQESYDPGPANSQDQQ